MKNDSGYRVVQAGETFSLEEVAAGTAFAITPSEGASMTGQYSVSAIGNFVPCEFGTISQQFVTTIDGACFYLKFTAAGGPVTVEWGTE